MDPSPTPIVNLDLRTIDWKVVLGAITAVIALITIFYFQWWRNRKRFSYEVVSNNLVISNEQEVRDTLEIRYAGQPVKDVRLIVIKLINDGYQPIKKEDFEESVKIVFPKARILTAQKVKTKPKNLKAELRHQEDLVEVMP